MAWETTLNKIREWNPCAHGWRKLLRHLGKTEADDEPLPLLTILESNGLDDTLWCLRAVEGHDSEIRLFAVWCARQVAHLMTDERSLKALDVAEAYARGEAGEEELDAALATSWAAWTTRAARATRDAAWAVYVVTRANIGAAAQAAARDAARAARDAARAAALAAAQAARDATLATRDAAQDDALAAAWDAWDAAWDAARTAQEEKFKEMVS